MATPVVEELDLDLAINGYLQSCDGRLRRVDCLAEIAERIKSRGVHVYWANLPDPINGLYAHSIRSILIPLRLFDRDAEFVRHVLSHELGHVIVGRNEERVREWQWMMHPEWHDWTVDY